jgi:hypothetical protein
MLAIRMLRRSMRVWFVVRIGQLDDGEMQDAESYGRQWNPGTLYRRLGVNRPDFAV